MAGSEMGGRLSEDDAGYSMDGRFSCSSLYSEFGHVASHLEERHPGLVLARQASDHRIPPFLWRTDTFFCISWLLDVSVYSPSAVALFWHVLAGGLTGG